MYIKKIICLANSKKPPSGRCIAGKVFENDNFFEWVRPVSERATHEVSEDERRYQNGRKAKLLDIISVPLSARNPIGHQSENHTLDPNYWEMHGVATWEQVVEALDIYDPSFWAHSASTYYGLNDKVAEENLGEIGTSLKLIRVTDLKIFVIVENGFQGRPARRRVRAKFSYEGSVYLLSVSDPEIEEEYFAKDNGDYLIGNAVLCISLVEPIYGYSFRVVASIITEQRCIASAA